MKDFDKLLSGFLQDFNPKQRKVLEGRFGFKNGVQTTLQKIGSEIGVTRERVRQIEEQGLKKLKPKLEKEAADIMKSAKTYLASVGGIRSDSHFLRDLSYTLGINPAKIKQAEYKLRFILLVAQKPFYHKEDDKFYSFWYSDDNSRNKFFNFVTKLTKLLKSADKEDILEKRIYLAECRNISSCHLLAIPKHLSMNVFGDFGLKSWSEINPKTVRDKAYLVLKKHGNPLHFTEIAKFINHFGIDKKPAHVQTVHNELIKDKRFVLIGRGMYALGEHGFEPGTVKEVITKLLKSEGPLKPTEIVRLVNQQRILKENTILLNLQNRRHFKRLEDGRYHIREA